MKRIMTIILSLILMLSFVGCTSNTDTSNEESIKFEEVIIVDNDKATFKIVSEPDMTSLWGAEIKVFIENKTDVPLMFSLDNTSANGYMVNTLFATEVEAGKKENTSITIFSSDLEENEITNINDFEAILNIYNSENWEEENIIKNLKFSIQY